MDTIVQIISGTLVLVPEDNNTEFISANELLNGPYNNDTLFQKPPNGTDAFLASCTFNTMLFVFGMLVFSLLRQKFPDLYQPRCTKEVPLVQRPTPPTNDSLLGWMLTVFHITEEDIYQKAGLDAATFHRLNYLGMVMFGSFSIYGVFILLPINSVGSGNGEGIESFSMSNISAKSDKDQYLLIFHAAGIYIFSGLVYFFTNRSYRWFVAMRQRYLRGTNTKLYSAMVTNLPTYMQSSQALANAMEKIFPGDVLAATVNIGTLADLEQLCKEREANVKKLEKCIFRYQEDPTKGRPMHLEFQKDPFKKVDSIQFYTTKVKEMNQRITSEQSKVKTKYQLYCFNKEKKKSSSTDYEHIQPSSSPSGAQPASELLQNSALTSMDVPQMDNSERIRISKARENQTGQIQTFSKPSNMTFGANSGFVIFKSHKAATMAVQCVPEDVEATYDLQQAPDPCAVMWSNISANNYYPGGRWLLIWMAVVLLTAVFTIPAAALVSLTSLDNLEKLLPFIKVICENYPTIKGLLEGVVPQVGIILFYVIMPQVLYILGMYEGHMSWGDLELSVVRKWFMFQSVNVFFAPAVSSSVLLTLRRAQKDTSHIPELLGQAIPSASTFFINYTIMRICLTQTMELIRLGAVLYTYMGYWTSQTPTEREETKNPGRLMYGDILPRTLLLFLIGATYAVVAPLILPFVTLFFAASVFVWKYQLSFVYNSEMDNGGMFWFVAFRRIMYSTIFAQLTVIGIFSLKQSYLLLVVLPLPVISAAVIHFYTKWYQDKAMYLSLDEAISADLIVLAETYRESNDGVFHLIGHEDSYLQPVLTTKPSFPRLTEQFINGEEKTENSEVLDQILRELAEGNTEMDEIIDEDTLDERTPLVVTRQ
eukprot:CFRG4391T1